MPSSEEMSKTMHQFFNAMDLADYGTTQSLFATDAVWVGPPFSPGQAGFATGMVQLEGLDAIKEGWEARGHRDSRHEIVIESTRGHEWFAEGRISLDGHERVLLMHVTFNDAGLIERFVAAR